MTARQRDPKQRVDRLAIPRKQVQRLLDHEMCRRGQGLDSHTINTLRKWLGLPELGRPK